ncbi:MAG: hypothetical protein JWM53_6136 [bacterium]|nr:hypothetical protein [bacterium]
MSDDPGTAELDAIDEALALAGALPATVVAALFQRYGKPLAEALPPVADDERSLALAGDGLDGALVRVLNVRTAVDVIGNDWFVLQTTGAEPLAVAGPLFAAALAALTRAARLADAKK